MAASVVCEEMTNEAQRHITKSHEPRYIISTLKRHFYLAPSPCPRLFQKKKTKKNSWENTTVLVTLTTIPDFYKF